MKSRIDPIKLLLSAFLIITIIYPLIVMFTNLNSVDIGGIISSSQFITISINSLKVTIVATLISVTIALLAAWFVARSNIKRKKILIVLLTIPMLIPSISHGTGLVVLFGNNGVLTNLLGLNFPLYGFWGIVLGSFFYSFPVAFLMFYDNLQYEDGNVYLSANVLGIPKINQLFNITLPYLRKPMISAFFTVFTLIFTDYGVPLMVGGKYTTLPLYMYNEVIGLLDFGKGALIGLVLMIPAFIAFIIDVLNKEYGNYNFNIAPYTVQNNKIRDRFSKVFLLILTGVVLMPIFVFVFLIFIKKYPISIEFSLTHIERAMDLGLLDYLRNSLIIALLTAIVGTVTTFTISYYTSRTESKVAKMMHLISMISLAIPGLVLGLSYVLAFKTTFIYGTIAILILVNSIHFFASPYLMSYNALSKLNPNYEVVAKTLGIPKFKIIMDVIIPQTRETILEQFSYFFVNSMVTISAVSFLATTKNNPLSLMIPNLESMMLIESISFVSIVILFVNLVLKGIIHYAKIFIEKQNMKKEVFDMSLERKEFKVLELLEENRKNTYTQRELAEELELSLGTINSTTKQLREKGYIDDELKITVEGLEALEPYRVKRAIFIAAGFGSRLVPLTINSPKPLIRVNGVRMIDTLLDAVYAAGIEEVIIVRGYLKEQFDQLLYKYPNIKFIDNMEYSEANNISSAFKVRHLLQNAYVMEADLVLSNKKLVTKYQYTSNYLGVKTDMTDDWCLQVNRKGIVTKMMIGGRNVYHMYGISYWNAKDGKQLEEDIKKVYELPGGKERYWDQVALEYEIKNYEVEVRPCTFDDIVEIDSYSDLKKIDSHYQ